MFVAMSVIWGLPYLLIKVAVGGVPVPVLVLARVSLGAAVLLPIALRRGRVSALTRHWPGAGALAGVQILPPLVGLSHGRRGTTGSLFGPAPASRPRLM